MLMNQVVSFALAADSIDSMPNLVDLQKADDPRDLIHRAVQALAEGHVIALPTETVYTLAASGLNAGATKKLLDLRRGDPDAVFALAVRSTEAVLDFTCSLSPLADRFATRCWPGPLTLKLTCDQRESALTQLPELVRGLVQAADGSVGFRVIDHRVFQTLHQFIAAPIVLTSASLAGQPPATTAEDVAARFGDQLPLIISDGPCRYSGPSTVVRVVGNLYDIMFEGAIERAAMRQFSKPIVAVVCTGNTCRSPMAEALLRERLRQKTGSEDSVLVVSAGVAAMPGSSAAQQAVQVMSRRGLDLTGHGSRPLDERLVGLADLILTMTKQHAAAILARWPELGDRVRPLRHDGQDISDPVGAPVEVYDACAAQIDQELELWVEIMSEHGWLDTAEVSRGEASSAALPNKPNDDTNRRTS